MKLSVKILDIASRGVLLHCDDAKQIGVFEGDRVKILNEKTGTATADFVMTTSSLLVKGTCGIYQKTNDMVGLADGDTTEVRVAIRPVSLDYIRNKMDGARLTQDEITTIVRDIVHDDLSPCEVTAFVTATYINTLDIDEIEYLTRAMVDTGEKLSFHTSPIVDKHSIGGVPGNKISFLVVPIIAAAGLLIPKTSSRAITGAGGTADLMEVLAPVAFPASEIQVMTEKTGGVIVWGGATNIAPADDKIILQEYPFKIDAIGQMIASVMAKKCAVGADILVIDIPVGKYCKVHDVVEARKLARMFIELGERLGMQVECSLTYGDAPVGHAIGPALEVKEALAVLEGADHPRSLIQKSTAVAGMALEMAGKAGKNDGERVALEILKSGRALAKFKEMIEVQGGNPDITSNDIKPGDHVHVVRAASDGYVISLHNKALITIARVAGAPSDHRAGVYLHAKQGTYLKEGDPIFSIYAERKWRLENAIQEGRRLMPVVVEGMLLDRVPHAQSSSWRMSRI